MKIVGSLKIQNFLVDIGHNEDFFVDYLSDGKYSVTLYDVDYFTINGKYVNLRFMGEEITYVFELNNLGLIDVSFNIHKNNSKVSFKLMEI